MDPTLESYLKKYNISYQIYLHKAVFTVEESKKIKINIPALHTKSLFLKDENNNFYLVCIPALKRLNVSALRKKLSLKKLFFASPIELKEQLNLTPGSVSLFGMIYSKSVFLIIDKELWTAKAVGFHPNINTATIVLNHENLERFYSSIDSRKEILAL